MVKLTERLAAIANEIQAGESMADIGTDHAFLPIFLWEQGVSPKVIMVDISEGSLQKAAENCKALHPDENFDLRLGSGIEVIEESEVDCVVIAGMGGILMSEILGADVNKARSFNKLILQPRNNIGILRHWLYNNGFSIVNEQLVRESRFICEIITAVPREVAICRNMGPERIEYEYPHSLADFKGPLTCEYLSRRLEKERRILEGMTSSNNIAPRQIRSQKYRIEYLQRLSKSVQGEK